MLSLCCCLKKIFLVSNQPRHASSSSNKIRKEGPHLVVTAIKKFPILFLNDSIHPVQTAFCFCVPLYRLRMASYQKINHHDSPSEPAQSIFYVFSVAWSWLESSERIPGQDKSWCDESRRNKRYIEKKIGQSHLSMRTYKRCTQVWIPFNDSSYGGARWSFGIYFCTCCILQSASLHKTKWPEAT